MKGVETPPERTALWVRVKGRLSSEEIGDLDRYLEGLPTEGWAHCRIDADVETAREPDLAAFEEESIRAVADRIWEGDAEETVKRRALAMLADKVEATR